MNGESVLLKCGRTRGRKGKAINAAVASISKRDQRRRPVGAVWDQHDRSRPSTHLSNISLS